MLQVNSMEPQALVTLLFWRTLPTSATLTLIPTLPTFPTLEIFPILRTLKVQSERRESFRSFGALHLHSKASSTQTGAGDGISPKSRITLDSCPEDISNFIIQLVRKWGDVKGKIERRLHVSYLLIFLARLLHLSLIQAWSMIFSLYCRSRSSTLNADSLPTHSGSGPKIRGDRLEWNFSTVQLNKLEGIKDVSRGSKVGDRRQRRPVRPWKEYGWGCQKRKIEG